MTQEAQAMAPVTMRAPVQAQDMSEYMSLGVIVSWHISGFVPRGMRKPSCGHEDQYSDSCSGEKVCSYLKQYNRNAQSKVMITSMAHVLR